MSLLDVLKVIPPGTVDIVVKLLEIIFKLIKGGDDVAVQEEILMEAAEALKAELDRRKFGASSTEPPRP